MFAVASSCLLRRRKRHRLQDDDSCALCSQSSETIDHLLVACPFSREIWYRLLRTVGWEVVAHTAHEHTLADWWVAARKRIQKEVRGSFDSLVVLTCWILWKERNNRTFDRCVKTIDEVLVWVVDEILFWIQAGHRRLECCLSSLGKSIGRASEPV